MDHVSGDDATAFLTQPMKRRAYASVTAHLLSGCAECEARIRSQLVELEPHLTEEALDLHVILRMSARRRHEVRRAVVQWVRLSKLSPPERLHALENPRNRRYGLAAYILDQVESSANRRRFEGLGEDLAFASALVSSLPERVYGSAPIAALRLRHVVTEAHLYRHQQNYQGAMAALDRAEALREACGDRIELARHRRIEASILLDLGEFEEAFRAARSATEFYVASQDGLSVARSLLQEATTLAFIDSQAALLKAEEGVKLLSSRTDSLFVRGLQIVLHCLVDLGRVEESKHLLEIHSTAIQEAIAADPTLELLYLGLEARMLYLKGRLLDAESLYTYLVARYRDERMYQEMILTEIERIHVKAATGRWKSALDIASQVTPLLAALGLRADLQAMWAGLQDRLSRRELDLSIARNYFLRRWKVATPPSSSSPSAVAAPGR